MKLQKWELSKRTQNTPNTKLLIVLALISKRIIHTCKFIFIDIVSFVVLSSFNLKIQQAKNIKKLLFKLFLKYIKIVLKINKRVNMCVCYL